MKTFEIVQVRQAPEGFGDDVIGLVTFKFFPDPDDGAVQVTRWDKNTEKEYTTLSIAGARAIKVTDAPVRHGEKGPWLQANGLKIEYNISSAIAEQAAESMRIQTSRGGYTGNGMGGYAGPRGSVVSREGGHNQPAAAAVAPAGGGGYEPIVDDDPGF